MDKEKMNGYYSPMDDVKDALSEQSFKWWTVDESGNISYKGHSKAFISSENLTTENQLTHQMSRLRSEEEIGANAEFYFAYLEALRNAGYKKITIDVTNIHALILAE